MDSKELTFADRIRAMNAMYALPINDTPTLPADGAVGRLQKFKRVMTEELGEIDAIVSEAEAGATPIMLFVMLSDLLGDMTVFIRSEALKWGLPLEAVLSIIMDSNASKLGADGKPIHDADGKFQKGPNYWRPEPKIAELLQRL